MNIVYKNVFQLIMVTQSIPVCGSLYYETYYL
jgi:hypothetical protein